MGEAKQLLAVRDLSLSEIAISAGIAKKPYYAGVFSRGGRL
jgi:hypothetical protein